MNPVQKQFCRKDAASEKQIRASSRAICAITGKLLSLFIACSAVVAFSGCAGMKAPLYSPSFQNVQKLANVQSPISVGRFAVEKPSLDSVALRLESMTSPTGSYADYLKGAVSSELKMANKFS